MFETLTALPPDSILGLSAAFKKDPNPHKIDLGVGVYKDEQGNTPILECVASAQHLLLASETSKVYITPQGNQGFIDGMLRLLLGENSFVLNHNRVAAVQAPGGCGALRILAELLIRIDENTTVWVSDPTWANHMPLLGDAGLTLKTYPYFDKDNASIKFDEMMDCLSKVGPNDVVLLHGCCHNPTGADLSKEQWQDVAALAAKVGFLPFVDTAYQGFGDGIEEDTYGLRLLIDSVDEVIVAASCSKNFGLYRERVGLAAIICKDEKTRDIAQSQIQSVARGIYSMPPSYGGALVDIILNDKALYTTWTNEVNAMRVRMATLRQMLVTNLQQQNVDKDFSFINAQKGMFSFLCIPPQQVQQLRDEHSIYFVDSSRVNIAGINHNNVGTLAKAIAQTL
ncbi:aspartate aminotransferase [Glaciecola punicea ACAM 611]|uniref:Aminotransferase n=1 Tax=Glaciecola punicea ACAM 611 TaxID=1121923 RepID=H5TA07_9ALTE|nr:amino acid aminotransferase [Glaciecola punicea]OFA33419.1 aromatic amino acid aminotransferase [Glaciecola punicea]GAB55134.1 aspartate aminotransferase [Glaciecola punicea ACAM 611]